MGATDFRVGGAGACNDGYLQFGVRRLDLRLPPEEKAGQRLGFLLDLLHESNHQR